MSDKNGSEGRIQWSRFFKKLSPHMIQKGLLYLKHYGPREFWIRLHERFEPEDPLWSLVRGICAGPDGP